MKRRIASTGVLVVAVLFVALVSTTPEAATTSTSSLTTTSNASTGAVAGPPSSLAFSEVQIVFEGFGVTSVGGRGGEVIQVTNLSDSGPGSLRAAIEATGPRTVVFRVGGTIELESALHVSDSFLTIAGQTAPGDGITLTNGASTATPLVISAHDVIVSNLKIRPGPGGQPDGILVVGDRVVIDHVSVGWAVDENIDIWAGASEVTVQWSIISEALECSTHGEGCHSMGMLIGDVGTGSITIHHNLFAHNAERAPTLSGSGVFDIVNNVMYDAGMSYVYSSDGDPVRVNYVGNLVLGSRSDQTHWAATADEIAHHIYLENNETGPIEAFNEAGRQALLSEPNRAPGVVTSSPQQAQDDVLAYAGASLGLACNGLLYLRRDAVDARVVEDVRRGGGNLIDDPADVGGLPVQLSGVPCADRDRDGMYDEWEDAHELDPYNPGDAHTRTGSGLTNLESFLTGHHP